MFDRVGVREGVVRGCEESVVRLRRRVCQILRLREALRLLEPLLGARGCSLVRPADGDLGSCQGILVIEQALDREAVHKAGVADLRMAMSQGAYGLDGPPYLLLTCQAGGPDGKRRHSRQQLGRSGVRVLLLGAFFRHLGVRVLQQRRNCIVFRFTYVEWFRD